MKNINLILTVFLLLSSCDKKENSLEEDLSKTNEPKYRGVDIQSIPKVALVQNIFNISEVALEEEWSRQTWVIRFGKPSSVKELSNGSEIIRYNDLGPYQPPPSEFFLSGVDILITDDKTEKINYVHTEL